MISSSIKAFLAALFTLNLIFCSPESNKLNFTSPANDDFFDPGTSCLISWDLKLSPNDDTIRYNAIDLILVTFERDELRFFSIIASNIDMTKLNNFHWNVPLDQIDDGWYWIAATEPNKHLYPFIALSGIFLISEDYFRK